jgi:hypothetical protein
MRSLWVLLQDLHSPLRYAKPPSLRLLSGADIQRVQENSQQIQAKQQPSNHTLLQNQWQKRGS